MNQDPSVELDEKLEQLTLELERSLEELEERVAPMLASNHNETFVVDSEAAGAVYDRPRRHN